MKPYSSLLCKKVDAFSLTGILVLLVTIVILVLLALSRFLPLITRAKTTEAKLQLKHSQTLEQSYFFEHSRYSKNLNEIGFLQDKLTTEGQVVNLHFLKKHWVFLKKMQRY